AQLGTLFSNGFQDVVARRATPLEADREHVGWLQWWRLGYLLRPFDKCSAVVPRVDQTQIFQLEGLASTVKIEVCKPVFADPILVHIGIGRGRDGNSSGQAQSPQDVTGECRLASAEA